MDKDVLCPGCINDHLKRGGKLGTEPEDLRKLSKHYIHALCSDCGSYRNYFAEYDKAIEATK